MADQNLERTRCPILEPIVSSTPEAGTLVPQDMYAVLRSHTPATLKAFRLWSILALYVSGQETDETHPDRPTLTMADIHSFNMLLLVLCSRHVAEVMVPAGIKVAKVQEKLIACVSTHQEQTPNGAWNTPGSQSVQCHQDFELNEHPTRSAFLPVDLLVVSPLLF